MGRVCEAQGERDPSSIPTWSGRGSSWCHGEREGLKVQVLAFMSCGPRPSHFVSLNLSFFICKMKMAPLLLERGCRVSG